MNSSTKIVALAIVSGLASYSLVVNAKVRSGGTGFVINDQGYLITNNHVVSYDFQTKDGKRYRGLCTQLDIKGGDYEGVADIVGRDQANDLAVLKIRNFSGGNRSANQSSGSGIKKSMKKGKWRSLGSELAAGGSDDGIAKSGSSDQTPTATGGGAYAVLSEDKLRPGERVVVVGFPLLFTLSSQPKVTAGVLSSTAGYGHNVSRMQHTAAVNGGNSGGPAFNSSGHVIGVNVSHMKPGYAEDINFSIKMGVTRLFLESLNVPYSTGERQGELRTEEIMSNASRYTVLILCHF